MNTTAMNMSKMSPPQKRMLVQSMTGQRVLLQVRHGSGQVSTHDVEVISVAVDLLGAPDKATQLVVRMYGEDNRYATVPLANAVSMARQQWYLTDPRHPDYEAPGTVVRAAAKPRR